MITQTQTVTVDMIPFHCTMWFDETTNTVDIESWALVRSQYLAYPGSSLVEVEANVYEVPISEWDSVFESMALSAIATA